MNSAEDDDIKLLKASTSLLSDLQRLLTRVLRKKHGQVHRRVREADWDRIYMLVDQFQEDPQLLDTHLKNLIPPLVDAYLDYIRHTPRPQSQKKFIPLSHAVCRILNLFCKVRGEKVIAGFLNNEPRFFEAILHEHEKGENFPAVDADLVSEKIIPWEERYILLLWLSHLVLTPFPLASISALQSSEEVSISLDMALPNELPGAVIKILPICADALQSATKERSAAASLLVKLGVRPDMQNAGLLTALVKWTLSSFPRLSETKDIHQSLGILSFLSGLVASASHQEIGPYVPAIYQFCQNIVHQADWEFIKSSAVARKLVGKTLRNIVVHCLQTPESSDALDTTTILEEVIEYLLESVADGDTPVRYAASKALSVVAMKLDSDMAGEVVEAILGSLNENVYWQGSSRNLSGVNPLQWHGLTLTLSHLLYRRALSTDQLPDVLNALLLALTFEQRSATGGSVGTNVRDAACFGIWALARRYTTKELLAVEVGSIRASHQNYRALSVLQAVAIELVVVACLDPAGNIRRGSSAALQELIGRHPNTVEEGIPLVQVVDFHAVGLRERAMTDVAIKAAHLHHMYWEALFDNLLEWRGTFSLDAPSRVFAATAIGRLVRHKDASVINGMVAQICDSLRALRPREIEERHGLVFALSRLIDETTCLELYDTMDLTHLWNLLGDALKLEEKAFISPALRPELTALSMCNFLGSLSDLTNRTPISPSFVDPPHEDVVRLLNLCLGRNEEAVLQAIPRTASSVLELLSRSSTGAKEELVASWLTYLENEFSYNRLKGSGHAIALGAAYSQLTTPVSSPSDTSTIDTHLRIITSLTRRCLPNVSIAARTVALQALEVLLSKHEEFRSSEKFSTEVIEELAKALHIASNDYTVTERGDVGSLVRLEALNTIETAWRLGVMETTSGGKQLLADVLRLSLEKLDKVRARAAHVLEVGNSEHFEKAVQSIPNGVSSTVYFSEALKLLKTSAPACIKEAVLTGFVSSAGMGSESVVQHSRAALIDFIDTLPVVGAQGPEGVVNDFSLLDLANNLAQLLKADLNNDRILIPLMEVLAFLFDMQVLQQLGETEFSYRALLSLTQKAHFKSTHMHKLHLALDMYRGLGTMAATRQDTIIKVASMLLHPFPKIRITAAETLWFLTTDQDLKRHDWSLPSKSLKPVVEGLRRRVLEAI